MKKIKCFITAAMQVVAGCTIAAGQCTQSELRDASSFSNDASIGVRAWTNCTNAQYSDDSRSTSAALVLGQKTNYIRAEGYGFSIASTSYICGIVVEFERSATGLLANVTDYDVRLIKNGVIVGNNLASGSSWPSSDSYHSYGNSSQMWGTTWTPAEINAGNFGVAISANLGGISVLPTARIDHIRVSIYVNEALPVHLLSFDAHCQSGPVNLSWLTASETGNDYFVIQRSTDASEWVNLDSIHGNGNSNTVLTYQWIDNKPLSTLAYYRLLQVDYDHKVNELPIIAFKNNCFQANDQLVIFPNPAMDKIQVKYYSTGEYVASIKILDAEGKLKSVFTKKIKRGNNLLEIEIDKLPPANHYIFQMEVAGKSIQARFLK